MPAHRRHDITDKVWNLLESRLPGEKGTGVELPKIIGDLSMLYFGLCEQGLLGGTFLQTMVIGATPIGVLFAGEIRVYGRSCWKL